MLKNYILLLKDCPEDDTIEMKKDDNKKDKDTIKRLKIWIKELKSTGETHNDLKWKVDMLTEIYGVEKDAEILNPDEESLEMQKDWVAGIKEWLDDLNKIYKDEKNI